MPLYVLLFSLFNILHPVYNFICPELFASNYFRHSSLDVLLLHFPGLTLLCCPQAIMAQLPQEEKAKIAEQVESFRQEKCKLDAEVAKWDDNGNDIIVLAKQMCMIMMEMTDFTR